MAAKQQALLMAGGAVTGTPACVADQYYTCGPNGDPFWNNVVLMLHGEGANGATTATDSSLSARVSTRSGSAQISTAQKKFGEASLNNTSENSSYFQFPFAETIASGEPLTVEFWLYISTPSGTTANVFGTNYLVSAGWSGRVQVSGNFANFTGQIGTASVASGSIIGRNTWHHVALTRDGTNVYLFVDGNLINTQSSVGAAASLTYIRVLGSELSWGFPASLIGFIDEFRVTKGIARYTGPFNIPTSAFPDAADSTWQESPRTVLSLHAETSVANTSTPNGINLAATAFVRPELSLSNFNKTYSYSGNTASIYAAVLAHRPRRFGKYYYEVRPTGLGNVSTAGFVRASVARALAWDQVLQSAPSAASGNGAFYINMSSGGIGYQSTGLGNVSPTGANQTYMFAIDFDNNKVWVGVNGVWHNSGNPAAGTNQSATLSEPVALVPCVSFDGSFGGGAAGTLRLSAADLQYSPPSGFSPWASDSPPINDEFPTSDTSCFQSKVVAPTGVAAISDVEKKFGSYSFLVQNTGASTTNGIVVNDHQDFDFGTGDFTIELWAYRTSSARTGYLFWYSHTSGEFSARVRETDNILIFNLRSSGGLRTVTTTTAFPLNQWNMVVVQRLGTRWYCYLNGTRIVFEDVDGGASATVNSIGNFFIGRTNAASTQNWQGYIDEVRVTRGVARYGTFTPPGELPADSSDPHFANVTLLVRGNGSPNDQSPLGAVATPAGTAQVSTTVFKYGSGSIQGDGNGDWYEYPYTTPIVTNSVYTIEFWVRFNIVTGKSHVLWALAPAGMGCIVRSGGIEWFGEGGSVNTPFAFAINTWYHVAFVKSSTNALTYINGVLMRRQSLVNATVTPTAIRLLGPTNGFAADSNALDGYLDDFRITMGVARYTTDFDPAILPNCDATYPFTSPEPENGTAALTGVQIAVTTTFNDPSRVSALSGQQLTVSRGSVAVPAYPTFRGNGLGVSIGQFYNSGTAPAVGVWFRPDGNIAFAYERNGVSSPWFVRPANQGWLNFTNSAYTPAQVVDKYRFAYVAPVRGVSSDPRTTLTTTAGTTMADGVIIWYRNGIPNFTNYQVAFFVVIEVALGHPAFGQPNQIFVTFGQTSIGFVIDNFVDPSAPPVEAGFV